MPLRRWRKLGIRKILVKNFIMYYWVDKEHQIVHIAAVVYEKRDQLWELGKMKLESEM